MSKKEEADHGKGNIKDNGLKAVVRSKIFRQKIEKDKTKYQRKSKHKKSHSDGFQ